MAIFMKGERVKAQVSVQGLVQGRTYTIETVDETVLPFGIFVAYDLRDEDGNLIDGIQNGHLILSRTEPPKKRNTTCGECMIHGGKYVELQDQGDHWTCPECTERYEKEA